MVTEVDFVGYDVSAEGHSPLRANIEAIHQVPEPSSAAQTLQYAIIPVKLGQVLAMMHEGHLDTVKLEAAL